jgi:hypothetical protein
MKKWLITLIASLLLGFGLFSNSDSALAGTMEYSVKANIPDNQINKQLTYFDLKMSPGSKQTISLTLTNTSNEEKEIMIEPNTAITNQNGVIDYSKNNHKKDRSLKYAFSDLISPKQKVVLKGNETKEVPFTIEMPEKSYDGVILGGFYIYELNQSDKEQKNQGVQLKNQFSYIIGVKLKETDESVSPDLKLNKVKAGLVNYRTVVTANLQNIKPVIINNLDVDARITKEGQNKVLHQMKKENLSMAPNSNFDFPISWDNQRLEPGKYHLTLIATDGNQTWKFDKMFEVKGEVAKELNKTAVEVEKDYTLLFIGLAIVILALILIIIILLRKKKRGETDEESL